MQRNFFNLDPHSVKFVTTKEDYNLDLELLLKSNWDPETRDLISSKKSFYTDDIIIEWGLTRFLKGSIIPILWNKIFLNQYKSFWYQTWFFRVSSFIVFFIPEIFINWFLIIKFLIKNQKLKIVWNKFWQIYSFIWLFTVQEFMQFGRPRITVVNIVKNTENKYLLALRRHQWIPGDEGWGWFQGGLEEFEELEFESHQKAKDHNALNLIQEKILIQRAKIELEEETNLKGNNLKSTEKPFFSTMESMSVSIKRFLLLGCRYNSQLKYIIYWEYNSDSHTIKTDFENAAGGWFDLESVSAELVPQKKLDWENFWARDH